MDPSLGGSGCTTYGMVAPAIRACPCIASPGGCFSVARSVHNGHAGEAGAAHAATNHIAWTKACARTRFAKPFSSPILACRVFTTMLGSGSLLAASPKTQLAPSRSWSRRCLIWFGCTSNSCANSLGVFSPLVARHRHFRLECRAMVPARSCFHGHLLVGIMLRSGRFPTIQAVQISRTTSDTVDGTG